MRGQTATEIAKEAYQPLVDLSVELLPLSVAEIRHVLWAMGQALPLPASPGPHITLTAISKLDL